MRFPKQINQHNYMGKKCEFTAELCRDYGKERSEDNIEFGTLRKVPVKWKKINNPKISKTGWIVGFGFCFDGTLCTEVGLGENSKYFSPTKRVNYVRVRQTPTGQELKIPATNLKLI